MLMCVPTCFWQWPLVSAQFVKLRQTKMTSLVLKLESAQKSRWLRCQCAKLALLNCKCASAARWNQLQNFGPLPNDPGLSPLTNPRSSGCSMMKLPPAAWQEMHAAMHRSTNMLASSTTVLWCCESHGKPRGQLMFLSGRRILEVKPRP